MFKGMLVAAKVTSIPLHPQSAQSISSSGLAAESFPPTFGTHPCTLRARCRRNWQITSHREGPPSFSLSHLRLLKYSNTLQTLRCLL